MKNVLIGYKLKPEYKKYTKICDELTKGWWLKYADNNLENHKYHFACEKIENYGIEAIFRKAGVLHLWFEPVESEIKFEVGDWVVWTLSGHIGKIKKHCFMFNDSWNLRPDGDDHGIYSSCSEVHLRLATLNEIKKAITPDIEYDGHKLLFDFEKLTVSDLGIEIELISIDRVYELLKMANSLNNDQINCVCINTVPFTPEDISEIYEFHKEINDAKKNIK